MKTLIFCEGKHDSQLLEQLFKLLKLQDYHIFSRKSNLKKEVIPEEDIVIKRFNGDWSPYKFLVKPEGGRDFALLLFSEKIIYCLRNTTKFKSVLFLDADGKPIKNYLEKIEKKLNSGKSPALNFNHKIIHETDMCHLYDSEVAIGNQNGGSFKTLLFKRDLELELDSIGNEDDDINEKICQLCKIQHIQDIFRKVLL